MNNVTAQAYELVEQIFEKNPNRGGRAYMQQLLKTTSKLKTKNQKAIALLHDVIKDSYIIEEDLISLGFVTEIVNGVTLLTKQNEESYDLYIKRIADSNDVDIIITKLALLETKIDSYLGQPSSDELTKKVSKYKRAYIILEEKLQNLCLA